MRFFVDFREATGAISGAIFRVMIGISMGISVRISMRWMQNIEMCDLCGD